MNVVLKGNAKRTTHRQVSLNQLGASSTHGFTIYSHRWTVWGSLGMYTWFQGISHWGVSLSSLSLFQQRNCSSSTWVVLCLDLWCHDWSADVQKSLNKQATYCLASHPTTCIVVWGGSVSDAYWQSLVTSLVLHININIILHQSELMKYLSHKVKLVLKCGP